MRIFWVRIRGENVLERCKKMGFAEPPGEAKNLEGFALTLQISTATQKCAHYTDLQKLFNKTFVIFLTKWFYSARKFPQDLSLMPGKGSKSLSNRSFSNFVTKIFWNFSQNWKGAWDHVGDFWKPSKPDTRDRTKFRSGRKIFGSNSQREEKTQLWSQIYAQIPQNLGQIRLWVLSILKQFVIRKS